MASNLIPLSLRTVELKKTQGSGTAFSFISSDIADAESLEKSINSIDKIGNEIGHRFEIILPVNKESKEVEEVLRRLSETLDNFSILRVQSKSRGYRMKAAFKSSSGKFIIPFSAAMAYDIGIADLIHSFTSLGEKRMLYSSLIIIPREIISEVGSWRGLHCCEDIDLYSRIAVMYGVIAYPTSFYKSGPMKCVPRLERKEMGSLLNKYRIQRDAIIGCNYNITDLMALYRNRSILSRAVLFFSAIVSYAGSKFSKIKPYKFDRNNYLVFMESVFESLVIQDYKRIDSSAADIALNLSEVESNYLLKKSRLFNEVYGTLSSFINRR